MASREWAGIAQGTASSYGYFPQILKRCPLLQDFRLSKKKKNHRNTPIFFRARQFSAICCSETSAHLRHEWRPLGTGTAVQCTTCTTVQSSSESESETDEPQQPGQSGEWSNAVRGWISGRTSCSQYQPLMLQLLVEKRYWE